MIISDKERGTQTEADFERYCKQQKQNDSHTLKQCAFLNKKGQMDEDWEDECFKARQFAKKDQIKSKKLERLAKPKSERTSWLNHRTGNSTSHVKVVGGGEVGSGADILDQYKDPLKIEQEHEKEWKHQCKHFRVLKKQQDGELSKEDKADLKKYCRGDFGFDSAPEPVEESLDEKKARRKAERIESRKSRHDL